MRLFFDSRYQIIGCNNDVYLLEKSRVVGAETNERGYHIFYQVLAGCASNNEQKAALHLSDVNPSSFGYLRNSGCFDIPGVDDQGDFQEVAESLAAMGFSEMERGEMVRVIVAVLKLGNIDFNSIKVNPIAFKHDKAALNIKTWTTYSMFCTHSSVKPHSLSWPPQPNPTQPITSP